MTVQIKTVIKAYFETGDRPSQAQFVDLIDSYQDVNAALTSFQAVGTAAGKIPYATASATWSEVDSTAFGRGLLNLTAAVNLRSSAGLETTSTNNAVAKFNGATGATQNTAVLIDASNNVTGIVDITNTGNSVTNGAFNLGDQTLTTAQPGRMMISSGTPTYYWCESDAAVNARVWNMGISSSNLTIRSMADSLSTQTIFLAANRSGSSIVGSIFTIDSGVHSFVGGGITVGSPTGGDKGAGTVNATAVYDDNVLLTCYVIEAFKNGSVDLGKWDELALDRVWIPTKLEKVEKESIVSVPVYKETTIDIFDEVDGELVKVGTEKAQEIVGYKKEKQVSFVENPVPDPDNARHEPRYHHGAKKFSERLKTEYDPLDLDKYWNHALEKGHLTSMPNREKFDPAKGISTGEIIQRLWETVEIQAVHIHKLNERLKTLEGK